MIIDNVTIDVQAGDGGNGSVSFRREKFIARGGPDGGNGGHGGSIFFEAVSDLSALRYFRYKKVIKAEKGGDGQGRKKHGGNADDIHIKIPVGTVVKDVDSERIWSFDEVGEVKRIAKGGRGGYGNFEFRTSTNQAPTVAKEGAPGERFKLTLDLKYIAQAGLIGLPSAGKSSLLNALTDAHAKVGAYPFTTLEPNLGALGDVILADIPGLIEGAHEGKGLGVKFLKHIEKTKVLLHCIDATSDDVVRDYTIIRDELRSFSEVLIAKREVILVTKSDLVDAKKLKSQLIKLSKFGEVYPVSIIDDEQLKKLHTVLLSV